MKLNIRMRALRWVPVVENSTRAAMLQTGEAQFIQMAPVEQIPVLKADPNLMVNVVPSVVMRYMSMNMNEKPFDNPKAMVWTSRWCASISILRMASSLTLRPKIHLVMVSSCSLSVFCCLLPNNHRPLPCL